jgi:hypothetical protein
MLNIFNLNNWAIVNLTPTLISFTDKNNSVKAKLPSSLFSNFELSQVADLEKIIDHLLKDIKNNHHRLIISISDQLTFNQSFPQSEEITNLAQNYIDNIPLDRILFSLTRVDKGYQLVVINQNIIDHLQHILKKYQFIVKAVIPESVLKTQKIIYNQPNTLIPLVSANFSDSFPNLTVKLKPNYPRLEKLWKKPKKLFKKINKLYLILPLILIIIFLIIIFSKTKIKNPNKEIPIITPTPTQIIQNPSSINLQVTYTRFNYTKTLNQLKSDLGKLGFNNISLVFDSTRVNNSQTYIIFSTTTSANIKELITKAMNNLFADVTVQQSLDLKADTINLKLGRVK